MNHKSALWWARWLAFASSAVIVLGIAPSQILLGMSLAALLVSREKLRLPPIKLPLGLFLLGTLIAVALSGDPLAGFPQVKKIYVFSQLLVVYTLIWELTMARWLVLTWAGCGAASALLGVFQFAVKVYRIRQAHLDFYTEYVPRRITGFMSHWYTFSVEEMLVLLMLGSFLLFSPVARRHIWLWGALAVTMGLGIVLAETRAVWIATAIGAAYLLCCWRPWVALAVPLFVVLGLLAAPPAIRERAISIARPGPSDSNEFRAILLRTGIRMVEAHPWFGLGPEMPRKRFMEFLPADTPRPLPAGSYMHLHNLYLEYAAERGIPVLLILLWLLGKILWDFARGVRSLPPGRNDRRFLLHGGIAVVISLLVEGMADVNLGDSEVLTIFLVVVALGYQALAQEVGADSTAENRQVAESV
ncbi:MAG TPA: O-antigen ligase family protein [Bryobacteraceae bacterium]|nr:O-antigen ligase family protein [Bryobacteraceae bacterium]